MGKASPTRWHRSWRGRVWQCLSVRSSWRAAHAPCPLGAAGGAVVSSLGADVTAQYRRGAEGALRLAELYGCTTAVLKERSPSCGSGHIYDGTFTGTVTEGWGTAAALLRRHGVRVLGESQLASLLEELGSTQ